MKNVFIIEDDHNLQKLIKTLLEMEGFLVYSPSMIEEKTILQELRGIQADIVFMDVNLKHLSGFSLIKVIKNDDQLKAIKIIMSSGMCLQDECLEAGANAFIQKPYMPAQLIDLLKNNG